MACTDPPSYAQKLDGCLCCQSDQTLSTICIQLWLVSGGYSCEYKIRTAWCMKNSGSKQSLIQWFLCDSALVNSYHWEKRSEDQAHNLQHLRDNIQPDLYGPPTVSSLVNLSGQSSKTHPPIIVWTLECAPCIVEYINKRWINYWESCLLMETHREPLEIFLEPFVVAIESFDHFVHLCLRKRCISHQLRVRKEWTIRIQIWSQCEISAKGMRGRVWGVEVRKTPCRNLEVVGRIAPAT